MEDVIPEVAALARRAGRLATADGVSMVNVDFEPPAIPGDYVAMIEVTDASEQAEGAYTVYAFWNEDDNGRYSHATRTVYDRDGNTIEPTKMVTREEVTKRMAEELSGELEALGIEDATAPAILDALATLGYELTTGDGAASAFYASLQR